MQTIKPKVARRSATEAKLLPINPESKRCKTGATAGGATGDYRNELEHSS